jgi:SHS2 domain-containing protein
VTWSTFEHAADLGLLVDAPDGATLFAECALAMLSTMCELDAVEERETYELAGKAPGVDSLLVDWLNDVVFLFEARAVVCRRVVFGEWRETAYRAALFGEPVDPVRHEPRDLVKAATYHGLEVRRDGTGWHARVILDV